jgi:hypothetical protein
VDLPGNLRGDTGNSRRCTDYLNTDSRSVNNFSHDAYPLCGSECCRSPSGYGQANGHANNSRSSNKPTRHDAELNSSRSRGYSFSNGSNFLGSEANAISNGGDRVSRETD